MKVASWILGFGYFVAAVVLSACGGGEEIQIDGSNTYCPEERQICSDMILLRCEDGKWVPQVDCSEKNEICLNGACQAKAANVFEVATYTISDDLDPIDIDTGENGADVIVIAQDLSTTSETVSYSLSTTNQPPMPLMAKTSIVTPATDAPFGSRRFRYQRDNAMRERDRLIFNRNRYHNPKPKPVLKESQCQLSWDCDEESVCEQGTCQSRINLHFSAWTIFTEVTATVLAKGHSCTLLIDERSPLPGDWTWELLQSCEHLVERGRDFFSQPSDIDSANPHPSDRNRDGQLQVLISSYVNDEGVWGFFSSADFWPDDDPQYPSNERDMIYVSIPTTEAELPSIKATLIHEYQHLLHFTGHTWTRWENGDEDAAYAPVWLDEAMAHLAEEVSGYGVDNPELVSDFLAVFDRISLAFDADTLNQRAMGMLLMMYLFEQQGGMHFERSEMIDDGGAAFLRNIVFSELNGFDAVEEAAGESFDTFFADWLVTVMIDGTNTTGEPRYNYNELMVDPYSDFEIGVVTNGTRSLPGGRRITLNGPAFTTELSGAIPTFGAAYHHLGYLFGHTPLYVDAPSENFTITVLLK